MTEEKKAGKFQTFLFVIVIPLIFLIVVAFVGMWLLGVNFQDAASKIPVVKELVKSGEDQEIDHAAKQQENKAEKLQKTIDEQKSEIETLTSDLKTSDQEIKRLKQKISSLEKTAKDEKEQDEKNAEGQGDGKVVKIYESMQSNKAAKILSELKEEEAINILDSLSKKKVTEILSKMSPDKAAVFTEKLVKNEAKNEKKEGGE
ncbi:MotE family protein [Bacillus haynesii]|uniref:MotE family protein n=1 Tax=Bacillus haynesii TaxID=1925021 RepID=UPI001F368576|nr:MotE family protein [Bacillus haynesii]MCY8391464.1 MotE family protein [Bacillus haynesii]UIN47785.1 MotE family protein [Bacillus licheniformis]WIY58128.1 MotE family protein [Bacillus licheniformis]